MFLALTLLKLGNPVILDHRTERPADLLAVVMDPWPVAWGYYVLGLFAAVGVVTSFSRRRRPSSSPSVTRPADFGAGMKPTVRAWMVWLPALWLGWQLVAATQTVDAGLTVVVLKHFAAATICFYTGYFALGPIERTGPLWGSLLATFIIMLAVGFRQHYGGLEQTRLYVEANELTGWRELPPEQVQSLVRQEVLIELADGYAIQPELLRRIKNGRVFATFSGYPNALAGAILLLFPALAVSTWRFMATLPWIVRGVSVGLLGYMTLACLYWSGSKTGWLLALAMGTVVLLCLPLTRTLKCGLIGSVLVIGLAGFTARYAGYFTKGATSVSARMGCWQVAFETACERPFLGSGPGTFGRIYQARKQPQAEMAHLTHNDYLEQASDSGLIGFATYLSLFVGSIGLLYRNRNIILNQLLFAVWLGLFGWTLQGVLEFGLYIPALAWVAFFLLGWLWAVASPRNQIDNRSLAK